MSAELVDPFAPIQSASLSADELAAIRADIYAWRRDDVQCLPQMFATAREYIEARAAAGDPQAIRTLHVMAVRSTSGIPFGEPQEPADSLDPDPRVPRELPWEYVLGPYGDEG